MGKLVQILNLHFGQLTPKRDLGDGLFHCDCSCGGYREVTRKRLLDKSIKACASCARIRRGLAGGWKRETALPPEPEAPKQEPVQCNGKVVDGWLRCDATTCPKHRVGAAAVAQRPEPRAYPSTAISGR